MPVLKPNLPIAHEYMYDNIFVDSQYIHIGKYKLIRNEMGIYNQIVANFTITNKKDYADSLNVWLGNVLDADLGALFKTSKKKWEKLISGWEQSLIENSRPSIYASLLCMHRKDDKTRIIYGVIENGKLERITTTSDRSMINDLKRYLQYNYSIMPFCEEHGIQHPLEKSDSQIIKEIKQAILGNIIPTIEDVTILSNSPTMYSMAFYDLTRTDIHPTPAWDNFVTQFKEEAQRECFMAWLYSVFVGENKGRQLAWLHGIGNSGKSVIGNAIYKRLADLNPQIVTTLEKYSNVDKHSSSSYVGVRFTLDADSENRGILTNNLTKNLTGGDSVAVRGMGTIKQSETLYSKILATSNFPMWIQPEKPEQLTRLLYFRLDPDLCYANYKNWYDEEMGDWQLKINVEFDDFIVKCKPMYYKYLLPDGHNLAPYPEMMTYIQHCQSFEQAIVGIWWNSCIKQGEKHSILTLNELVDDYRRFLDKKQLQRWEITKTRKVIPSYLRFLKIFDSNQKVVANNFYITGYKFIEADPDMRSTQSKMINSELNIISKQIKEANND